MIPEDGSEWVVAVCVVLQVAMTVTGATVLVRIYLAGRPEKPGRRGKR